MNNNQNRANNDLYKTRDVTLTTTQTMLKGVMCSLPFVLLIGFGYRFLLLDRAVLLDISGIRFYMLFIAIIAFVTVVHEWLHGLGWAISSGKGWGVIKFNISAVMPSCACKVLLSKKSYLIGVLLPFIVLGIGSIIFLLAYPGTISLLTMVTSFVGAGGDLAIALNVIKERPDTLISDHPTAAGYVAHTK